MSGKSVPDSVVDRLGFLIKLNGGDFSFASRESWHAFTGHQPFIALERRVP